MTEENTLSGMQRLDSANEENNENEIMLRGLFRRETARQAVLVTGFVVPDGSRCVQCGICSYNCPIGIDVRRHALTGRPVKDSRCLTCGECVVRCPRGALRFEKTLPPNNGRDRKGTV